LKGIAEFIEKDSFTAAQKIVRQFLDAEIIIQSQAGRIVPEFNRADIRELLIRKYRVIYRLTALDIVEILTVHHGQRLLKNNPTFKKR